MNPSQHSASSSVVALASSDDEEEAIEIQAINRKFRRCFVSFANTNTALTENEDSESDVITLRDFLKVMHSVYTEEEAPQDVLTQIFDDLDDKFTGILNVNEFLDEQQSKFAHHILSLNYRISSSNANGNGNGNRATNMNTNLTPNSVSFEDEILRSPSMGATEPPMMLLRTKSRIELASIVEQQAQQVQNLEQWVNDVGIPAQVHSAETSHQFERNTIELELMKQETLSKRLDYQQLHEKYSDLTQNYAILGQQMGHLQQMDISLKKDFSHNEQLLIYEKEKNQKNKTLILSLQTINKQYMQMNEQLLKKYDRQSHELEAIDSLNQELENTLESCNEMLAENSEHILSLEHAILGLQQSEAKLKSEKQESNKSHHARSGSNTSDFGSGGSNKSGAGNSSSSTTAFRAGRRHRKTRSVVFRVGSAMAVTPSTNRVPSSSLHETMDILSAQTNNNTNVNQFFKFNNNFNTHAYHSFAPLPTSETKEAYVSASALNDENSEESNHSNQSSLGYYHPSLSNNDGSAHSTHHPHTYHNNAGGSGSGRPLRGQKQQSQSPPMVITINSSSESRSDNSDANENDNDNESQNHQMNNKNKRSNLLSIEDLRQNQQRIDRDFAMFSKRPSVLLLTSLHEKDTETDTTDSASVSMEPLSSNLSTNNNGSAKTHFKSKARVPRNQDRMRAQVEEAAKCVVCSFKWF